MQPYFFPYTGYFRLIAAADIWVVADCVQYIHQGWVNRNRVLHPATGWQYVIVPVCRHRHTTQIRDVMTDESSDWRGRIMGQLGHYRRRAPYFRQALAVVSEALGAHTPSIADLNVAALNATCAYIGLEFRPIRWSALPVSVGAIECRADWGLRVSQAFGATRYLNSPGGAALYDPTYYSAEGVELVIQDLREFRYETPGYVYIPHLSIIDAMMWNPPEAIRAFVTTP